MEVKSTHPFTVDAWVLLPEHLHCIWTLPEEDMDFSKRWGLIKAKFSKGIKGHRATPVWQKRFWEHLIRDERDLQAHFDYIHYNPVKHGLVNSPREWPSSTLHVISRKEYIPQIGAKGFHLTLMMDLANEKTAGSARPT